MEIREINENKKEYLELLLLADEQESMIDRYLERGEMYVLYDAGEVRAVCVVTQENDQILELKNLAVKPQCQRRGYGRKMIQFLCEKYRGKKAILQVGTGDSPATLPFYERCGFTQSHRIPGFFVDNYDHPIIECGKQLVDMVYLKQIIYVFLTIFLYLLKCPQSLILSALRAFCFCGKPHISRSIFLYFRYQAWLKSW